MFQNKNNTRRARSESTETFRRNTVVVSRSQREVAERKQSVTQRQIDAKKRRNQKRARRQSIVVITTIVVFSLSYRMRIAHVSTIPQDPSVTIPSGSNTAYEDSVQSYLDSQIPLRQSWLINADKLSVFMKQKHPEVKHVYVQSKNPIQTGVTIRLDFRKPIFSWQGIDGSVRYIDSSGVLFTTNYYRGIDVKKLPKVEDQGSGSSTSGAVIATEQLTKIISDIYRDLPTLYNTKRVERVVLPQSAREIQAYVQGIPYYITFSSDRTVSTQIGELKVLLSFLAQNGVTPSQYIDLRVPHKAFYK